MRLIVQLTGRSANLFLLDGNDFILDAMRENSGEGQQVNEKYAPPFREGENLHEKTEKSFSQGNFESLSEALDAHYLEIETEKVFQSKANTARNKLNQEIKKREKLLKNLNKDLENHGDAEKWKRFGDLLLANIALAKREGDKVFVTDFYDENTPTVEVEVEEHIPLTEAAEKFFKRYTKARNAQRRSCQTSESRRSGIERFERAKTKIRRSD